ncbi:hypothetical protein [Priestia megaterium]|uniref:hypothetical protein n=1 Tax=Priestia megaterium TaxID=1404 RepID=UPI000BFC19D3|nr:hypothetical protein [Priestia megaterium]PGQ88321.1 hypothetical protein COA18_05170 [Priestia megaterium]
MKKYSSSNLLQKELTQGSKNSFFGKLLYEFDKSSTKTLTLLVPMDVFVRAQVFCEDIEDLSGMEFTQADLIDILYMDFLTEIKAKPDHQGIFNMLIQLERGSGKDLGIVRSKKGSVFEVIHEFRDKNMEELKVKFRRKLILRGEILLADLESVFPDHGFMLENVLELLYCDFINNYRKGNNKKAVKEILKVLEEEYE